LGQIYEKLGRKQDAASIYKLAIAAGSPLPDTESTLVALVGTSVDTKQLVQDERVKFTKMRTVTVQNARDLNGEVEFWLLVERGPKVSAAKFVGGEDSLRSHADALKEVTLDFSFPDSEEIKLPRRARVTCSHAAGTCSVVLESAETVRSAN
jgi:hypothetical protein